jgi:putative membrane protein
MQGVAYFLVVVGATYLMMFHFPRIVPGFRAFLSTEWLWSIAIAVGAINAVLRPLLLRFGITVLGLSLLVLNAVIIWLAAWIAPQFSVDGYLALLVPGVVLSIVGMVWRGVWTALVGGRAS